MELESKQLVASSSLPDFFELAMQAAKYDVRIIPADLDRKRVVATILSREETPGHLTFQNRHLVEIMNDELDDESDFEFLQKMGVDLTDPRILIVHRGYMHLDNTLFYGHSPNRQGLDELLERAERKTKTVSVVSDSAKRMTEFSSDPLDINYQNFYAGREQENSSTSIPLQTRSP